MASDTAVQVDPKLDLILERTLDVPPEKVWAAYTQPELLKQWFTPRPWKTIEAEIDLRPGGIFRSVMQSPEGEKYPNVGCYLEVIENKRLVWTDVLLPGFRPLTEIASGSGLHFTAFILLEPSGSGTKYKAICKHRSPEDRDKHDQMGFAQGWGMGLDQLVELMKAK